MKAQHTPGPWQYDRDAGAIITQGITIARIAACSGYGEHDDNARLIAAAPDLLAALRKLDRLHRGLDAWHADADAQAWANARAVLANATGAES